MTLVKKKTTESYEFDVDVEVKGGVLFLTVDTKGLAPFHEMAHALTKLGKDNGYRNIQFVVIGKI